MFSRKKLKFKNKYEISLISCGDTGETIGNGIIGTLSDRGAKMKSLLITSGKVSKNSSVFDNTLSIDITRDGFAKKIDDSLRVLDDKREILIESLSKVIPKQKNQLLIVTTGTGATGLGSTLKVLEILYEEFKLIPPVFTLLPEVFENSRVQNNTAKFLYEVVFKKNNYGNAVILLDNKPSIDELEIPFSTISKNRLALIPIAIGDLLYGSFQKSISRDFEAGVTDLMEVIHTPGISVFVVEELRSAEGDDSTRLESIIYDSVMRTTSLNSDQVFEAKSAFITISDIDPTEEKLSFQTEFEAKKLYKEFSVNRPYVKFINSYEADDEFTPMLHAIVAGLPLPPRIVQIMQLGRDSRKEVIYNEYLLTQEIVEFDLDKVNKLQKKLNDRF